MARRIAEVTGWAVLLALGLGAAQCRGQARPDVAPPAAWVVPIPFDPRARLEPANPSEDMRFILQDRQINAENNETFYHEVRQILTPAGVNNGCLISVDYDPGYQLLTFHWARVWRDAAAQDRLNANDIEVGQRAPDADELLFSSKRSAILVLADVRVGDFVDFAYSLQGDNPVFAGRFCDTVQLQSGHSIQRLVTRLLWPSARRLYVQNHGTDLKYSAVRKGSLVEFTWALARSPALREEPSVPAWYQPCPWVQLSEFQKWSEVAQLALDLFTNTEPFSPELTRQINEWKALPGAEERALAALRFVQDEVRSSGPESGGSSYKPAAPSVVFERRSGDARDKTLFLVTALRGLGIEAWPTIVNTKFRQTVAALHPSAAVFDHAIVLASLGGRGYWLDATARYQRGPLAVRSWPNYGYGLVIGPRATELTPIAPSPVLPRTTVTEHLRLGVSSVLVGPTNPDSQLKDQSVGFAVGTGYGMKGGESELKVVTVAEGPDAERLRERFATTSRDAIGEEDLHALAKFYPAIYETAPLVYTDDEQQNQVEVDQFYSIPNIWKQSPDQIVSKCSIYPVNVEAAMQPPANTPRAMPWSVPCPVHQICRVLVIRPMLGLAVPDDQTIQNPAFYFHRMVTVTRDQPLVTLEYEYRSLADAVWPEAFPTYMRQLDAAAGLMEYSITSY